MTTLLPLDELPHRVRDDVTAYIDAREGWATVQAALGKIQAQTPGNVAETPAEPFPETADFRDGDPTIRIFSAWETNMECIRKFPMQRGAAGCTAAQNIPSRQWSQRDDDDMPHRREGDGGARTEIY